MSLDTTGSSPVYYDASQYTKFLVFAEMSYGGAAG